MPRPRTTMRWMGPPQTGQSLPTPCATLNSSWAVPGVPSDLGALIRRGERAALRADEDTLREVRARLGERLEAAGDRATAAERYDPIPDGECPRLSRPDGSYTNW